VNRFQTIIIIAFIAFIALAVIVFSTFRGNNSTDKDVSITIWGTADGKILNEFFRQEKIANNEFPTVTYVEKKRDSYERDLIEAVAKGNAPDIFLISPENLLELEDLIVKIPFSSYAERTFKDNFIEQGELFLDSEGIFAFPLVVDPMVMYWNRNLYQSAGLSQPPKFLDELFAIAPKITETDEAFNVNRSTFALGEYDNIDHAKEILSNLIIQSGNNIVERNAEGALISILDRRVSGESPAESALRFFTEFSNPTKITYSWNKSLPEAKEMFLSGRLATYFGFSSELADLRAKNPNLNFDIAEMPQIRDFNNRKVFGNILALAVVKNTPNLAPAFRLLGSLTSNASVKKMSLEMNLPPVRRDLLSEEPKDAIFTVFNKSAIISTSFIDPDRVETEAIFEDMIESTVSGRSRIGEAVNQASREIGVLIVEKR